MSNPEAIWDPLHAHALRVLALDATERAQSGHVGMPLGMADIMTVLWREYVNVVPQCPEWTNRDRIVLSNGHGSMLLYAALHLSGFNVSAEDIQQFRQWDSKTPGHPEYGVTPGVDTTTGPLGQGLANAVGFALAQRRLAAEFNRPAYPLVDHWIYCLVGDGCLMEGISHEAASLAGVQQLNRLVVIWDDNGISIDGEVHHWARDDVALRFQSYGWQVLGPFDGHDAVAIRAALNRARQSVSAPTLLMAKTTIGWGTPQQGSAAAHGAVEPAAIQVAKTCYGWPEEVPFAVPAAVYKAWDKLACGAQIWGAWRALWGRYETEFPELAAAWVDRHHTHVSVQQLVATEASYDRYLKDVMQQRVNDVPLSTRKAASCVLSALYPRLPALQGGSADLGASTATWVESTCTAQSPTQPLGNYLFYGVREFGMFAINNGLALYGGIIPFCSTFLVFSDYGRNALRMAALMKIHSIFVFSHDSIAVGEDGPTHQPVEQLPSLRCIPNLVVWRPADYLETQVAFEAALTRRTGPTAIVLTRQNIAPFREEAVLSSSRYEVLREQINCGAYEVRRWGKGSRSQSLAKKGFSGVIVWATGSEVGLALTVGQALHDLYPHLYIRVVSCPSLEQFNQQPSAYRRALSGLDVGSHTVLRVALEAAHPMSFWKWVGEEGLALGIETFGASAPGATVYQQKGLSPAAVLTRIRERLDEKSVECCA